MSRFRRPAAATLFLFTLWPTLAFVQAPRAGVVTTLEGNVTVTRVALPQPQPLEFKDDVVVSDKVTTGDKAIARPRNGSVEMSPTPSSSDNSMEAGRSLVNHVMRWLTRYRSARPAFASGALSC